MTAKQKANNLINDFGNLCKSRSEAKIAFILVCEEILKVKNYPTILNPEFVAFDNAY